jgi:heme acquisition protein HasA
MTTITTSANSAQLTVADLLTAWVDNFGAAAHGSANTGGFNTGELSGTQYATSNAEETAAYIAESDTGLSYNIQTHVVSGNLDGLTLGSQLSPSNINTSSGNYTLGQAEISFTDLNWNATTTNAALTDLQTVNTSTATPVVEQISDLLAGLSSSFADAVSAYNNLYDNDPVYSFDTITLAQLAQVDAAELTTVGSAAFSESELALAA